MTLKHPTPSARVGYLQQLKQELETARQVAIAAEGQCSEAVFQRLVSRVGYIRLELIKVETMSEATFAAWVAAAQPALVGEGVWEADHTH